MVDDSPCPSGHNTPFPSERSAPASFKRLLGSRCTVVRLPILLVTLEENRAASLSVYPGKAASPGDQARRGERNEEPLEHRETVQERLFPEGLNGDRLQRE